MQQLKGRHGIGLALTTVLVAVVWSVTGCTPAESAADTPDQPVMQGSEALAILDGDTLSVTDLPSQMSDQLAALEFQYRSQRHQLLDQAVRATVREELLNKEAARRGYTLEQLVEAETFGKIDVAQEEVAAWYNRNRSRLGSRTLAELSADIEQLLRQTKQQRIIDELQLELEKRYRVSYLVRPARAALNNDRAPSLGPENAPVTIVEFSDFQCPYCRVYMETLYAIRDRYEDQVRIVFRHFPLNIHADAEKAAEASMCAHEQDRFWQMHDLMFREQRRLSVDQLKEKAGRLGLDQNAFDRCLDSGRYAELVQTDMREGESFGVQGTPGSFVNGVPVAGGAVQLETLEDLVQRELRRRN